MDKNKSFNIFALYRSIVLVVGFNFDIHPPLNRKICTSYDTFIYTDQIFIFYAGDYTHFRTSFSTSFTESPDRFFITGDPHPRNLDRSE